LGNICSVLQWAQSIMLFYIFIPCLILIEKFYQILLNV
jgi:hypothetical protein